MNNNIDYSVFFEVYSNFKKFIQEIEIYKDKIAAVKMFEICFERSFKTIKQLLKYEGIDIANWPRDIFRKAAIAGIISDPKELFDFIGKKNLTIKCHNDEILMN